MGENLEVKEFTFLALLEFILKDCSMYKIFNGNHKCTIVSNANFSYKLYPQEHGFKNYGEIKKLNNDEIVVIQNDIFEILGIKKKDKIYSYRLFIDLKGNEISLNDITEFLHSKKAKQCKKIFDIKNKIEKQLNKYIANERHYKQKVPEFTEPVVIKMSFKSGISDISNHTFMFKILEDCLVKNGLIRDDDSEWVKEIIIDKQDWFEGVVITIRDYKSFKHIVDLL